MTRRIAIIGSRNYADLAVVRAFVITLPVGTIVVSGGAEGVDITAERAAIERGIPTHIIRPNYRAHGKKAPLVRNVEIAEICDEMRAFWDGESTGTHHAMRAAAKLGKPVWCWYGKLVDGRVVPGPDWWSVSDFLAFCRRAK